MSQYGIYDPMLVFADSFSASVPPTVTELRKQFRLEPKTIDQEHLIEAVQLKLFSRGLFKKVSLLSLVHSLYIL